MVCNRLLAQHLLRGLVAVALLAGVSVFGRAHVVLAGIALVGALVMLRGCPMCWLAGLWQTLAQQRGEMATTKDDNYP